MGVGIGQLGHFIHSKNFTEHFVPGTSKQDRHGGSVLVKCFWKELKILKEGVSPGS